VNSRVVVNAMEPRAALAAYDGGPLYFICRLAGRGRHARPIADALGVDAKAVRILTGQVGGSFGMKAPCFPNMSACCMPPARWAGR
jgi:carbon-monoxide dehydrogenase large subunit